MKVGWIEENGYVGYANADGELTQGEAKIDGKYYYFQPETGQLYTGWIMLDGVQYCFDETGHPRTGTYQEDGKVWELDSDGRVKNRLNGWEKNGWRPEILRQQRRTGTGLDRDRWKGLFLCGRCQSGRLG